LIEFRIAKATEGRLANATLHPLLMPIWIAEAVTRVHSLDVEDRFGRSQL
jgi:hypothetical protein